MMGVCAVFLEVRISNGVLGMQAVRYRPTSLCTLRFHANGADLYPMITLDEISALVNLVLGEGKSDPENLDIQ